MVTVREAVAADKAFLTGMLLAAVVEQARGRGVGGMLLANLVESARRRGIGALCLSVEYGNPVVALYRRHGFVPVDQVEGSYTMRLPLPPGRNRA